MVESVDFVIIGAGIMGCSLAYHLAERRAGHIVVLERDEIARGATADAAGGIRLQFSTETNIHLSLLSFEYWEHFSELFGTDIGLHQYGYLFLLTNPQHVEAFQQSLELQQALGVPARWVNPEEIARLQPAVRTDDLLGGTYCPRDGWCDPYSATMGFARAARELGVEFREHCPAIGFRIEQDRLHAVLTPEGPVPCGVAVICAGPYTGELGKLAGVELPVLPYRRMSFVTEPFDLVPKTVPMTIEFESSLYFHPEGDGFLFGMSNPNEPPGFNKTVDPEWMARTVEALCRRAPVFEHARIRRGWAGFYEVTPDDNPLLGWVDGVEGLAVAAGFSGHGFMHGPAVGRCMAELLLEGTARSVDISPFDPGRFRRGRLIQEQNVI
jgi:sarcosine oxidase subunit beta